MTRTSREDAVDRAYPQALLEAFAVRVGWPTIDEKVTGQFGRHLSAVRTHRFPDDVPQTIAVDLAFHLTLVDTARVPGLQELWCSRNAQIGALYTLSRWARRARSEH